MLPLNFHKTFIPERRLIAAILDYAAKGKQGNYQEISSDTGIPMGKSSGKVPAIIDYARGMGLIELADNNSSVKKPVLTLFGKTVYAEDKFLGEEITQWLAHMNLCRSDIGAKAWNAVFAEGRNILGSTFSEDELESYLIKIFGAGKRRTGPLVLTYTEDAGFSRAGVLTVEGAKINRKKAPLKEAYSIGYSAHILSLLESFFPDDTQITLDDFNKVTKWFDICLWSPSDIERVLSLMETKGYISVDRQMQPWILEKRADVKLAWQHIWDEIA
jgi:hypothetical protein